MKTDNIEKYLNSFGKQVVNRAKGNLQKAGKGGNLENSITFKVVTEADGFSVQFYMDSYGKDLLENVKEDIIEGLTTVN